MGMDLLTYGFTTRSPQHFDNEAVIKAITDLSDDLLNDNINSLDPSGGVEESEIRRLILDGAAEYRLILDGNHRMAADYLIPGTTLFFTIAGGGSWGDDPFDGWYALGIFLNACDLFHQIATPAALICWGLPDAATMALYP